MRIPVSRSARFQAETRTQYAEGPLPTAYPFSNGFVTLPDISRVLPANSMPGATAVDPRASLGFGTANYQIVPNDNELFNRVSSVGGSVFNSGLSGKNLVYTVIAVLLGLAVWKWFSR